LSIEEALPVDALNVIWNGFFIHQRKLLYLHQKRYLLGK